MLSYNQKQGAIGAKVSKTMQQKSSNFLWGFIFVAAGILLAGRMFDLWQFNLFFDGWWTLFIIIPCATNIIARGFNGGNTVGLLVGVALLLSCRDILPMNWILRLILPAVLVIIGLSIIFSRRHLGPQGQQTNYSSSTYTTEDGQTMPHYSVVFGHQEPSFFNVPFPGMRANVVFGGLELDLRNAVIQNDVTIDASVVFGGIEIRTPANVNIKATGTPILGGVENKSNYFGPDHPTIFLNYTCVFGGIEIH